MMRYILIIVMLLTGLFASSTSRWAILSDIHVLAPTLVDSGVAATRMATGEIKLPLRSTDLLNAVTDILTTMKIDGVLVTGDLTHNGERDSHLAVASWLDSLRTHGIATLVIPGNHDVNNPLAVRYCNEQTEPVASVSPREFASIYREAGYATYCDPNSLSYSTQLCDGVTLIAIDSNRYNERSYHSDGIVTDSLLGWVTDRAAEAGARGDAVVAMMHHHIVEHFDGETRILPNYIIANHDSIASQLANSGISHVFTGHLHITDAASDGQLTDISTGSAITFPFPMRVIEFSDDSIKVDTFFMENIDPVITAEGRSHLKNGCTTLATMLSRKVWNKLTDELTQFNHMSQLWGIDMTRLPRTEQQLKELVLKHFAVPLQDALFTVCRGGETREDAERIRLGFMDGIEQTLTELFPDMSDELLPLFSDAVMKKYEPVMRSVLEDINCVGTTKESHTDDHCFKHSLSDL